MKLFPKDAIDDDGHTALDYARAHQQVVLWVGLGVGIQAAWVESTVGWLKFICLVVGGYLVVFFWGSFGYFFLTEKYFSRRFHFAEHFWDALSWLMLFAPFLSFLMFCQRPTWIHLGRVVLIDAVGVLKITQPTSTLYHISSLGPAIKVQHCNLCSPGFGWVEFRLHQTFWRETKW